MRPASVRVTIRRALGSTRAMEHDPDLESLFDRFRHHGDVAALTRVFDAAAPELIAVARWMTRHASGAEDLVQQTFLTAIERRESFDSRRNLLPWMLGILASHAR